MINCPILSGRSEAIVMNYILAYILLDRNVLTTNDSILG